MTPFQIAGLVLKEVKDNYFKAPNADPERTKAWAKVFACAPHKYPDRVYVDAVSMWASRSSEVPTAKNILDTCKSVVADWERYPELKRELDEFRNARLKARETSGALPPGTTFSTPQTANEPRKRGTGAPPPEAKARMEAWRKKPHHKKLTPAERGDQSRQALNRLDQLVFQTLENVQKRQPQQAKEAQQ